jgi:TonB-linked SusC/RagA family outer membrane protein
MKKNLLMKRLGDGNFSWRKIFLVMRITLYLFLILLFKVSASTGYSQEAKLSLDLKNTTVNEALNAIEKQTPFFFLFNNKLIDVNRTITLQCRNEKIENVLNNIFEGTDVMYLIRDRQIILTNRLADQVGQRMQTGQRIKVAGKVTDTGGQPLPGVTVVVKGTTQGTTSDAGGNYSLLSVPDNATLVFSFVGMRTQEIAVAGKQQINVTLEEEVFGMEEVVVVGYGIQKKSDVTGTVASLPQERLEMVPNINIGQAIQGAIPGVMIQTSSAGSVSNEEIMIRGRNSIKASNRPLIVVDGIPYNGELRDLNPNDVKSIEILKDASAASIYGSRGANGVILVTTKLGSDGKPKLTYNGYYSLQRFTNLPELMNGEEFYNFKMERNADAITPSEQEIYESGEWVDWLDLALRNGTSTEHNLSVSGGFKGTQYYISGGVTDVKGLAVNDDYLRLTSRINVDTKISNWLTIGTRTQLSYEDKGGISPTWDGDQGVFWFNPLTTVYDENGDLTIYPWPEDTYFRNPLMGTLAKDIDETYQLTANNYAIVDFPFIKGLQYRINTGVRMKFYNKATYYGRNTQQGLVNRGDANTNRTQYNNMVIENIVNYNKEFGNHSVFVTGVYSFEKYKTSSNSLSANGFPNDFLTWYSASQAELIVPDYSYSDNALISSMLRINYSYDSRYLLTLTGRNDGYSGFGAKTKWGFFPSLAVGWNIAKEDFFQWKSIFNELKLRTSLGVNGNQAVGAYETISRLSENNIVAGTSTLPGYIPSKLGADNLGWESTKTLNVGLDFGILAGRITGDINLFKSNTSDLLLDRSISPIHGITSITQNIGKTENRGMEISFSSRNISAKNFKWITTGNISFVKNKIVSLYGELDEEGSEIDDISNTWFIGKPIRVNYGYLWDGVWQLDEAEEAESFGGKPGYIKIKDVSGPDGIPDGKVTADYDRVIIGQRDPKFIWGMSNSLSYKSMTLSIFMHGVHGMTKSNPLLTDAVDETVRMTTTKKNWWTPDNPTNDWYMNHVDANKQGGLTATPYEKAGFIRIKDISLSYDLSKNLLAHLGFDKLQIYITGRNLFTFTKYGGLDPELDGQRNIPLQKEYVFGVNLGF